MIANQVELDGDCLILASGFFQDEKLPKYSILNDSLLSEIQNNKNITKIRIIGVKGPSKPFNKFCRKLKRNWRGDLLKRRARGSNWHAKIAMKVKSDEEKPVCAIIGSSNLTRPAFGMHPPPLDVTSSWHFNYECDVLFFSNDGFDVVNQNTIKKVFPTFENQGIGSIYFPKLPEDCPNEEEQLSALLKDIMDSTIKVK